MAINTTAISKNEFDLRLKAMIGQIEGNETRPRNQGVSQLDLATVHLLLGLTLVLKMVQALHLKRMEILKSS